MLLRYHGPDDSPERTAEIEALLPKQTIIETILEPSIEKRLFKVLEQCLKAELEIYKKYPKRTFKNPEEAKKEIVDFDPRHPSTCFMGKAFKANTTWTDVELDRYRKAIGTIPHPVWGKCTLLEIWGGDHIADHRQMVLGAFKYAAGINKNCPPLKFYVNPLFQNKKSGDFKKTQVEIEDEEYRELLLAQALVFGVNTPKKKKRR